MKEKGWQGEAVWLPIGKGCDTINTQMDTDKERYRRACRFIHLLSLENAQLHAIVRIFGQLVDDMNNNCSYEVFEAEWKDITEAMDRLASFFARHQKNLKELHDECPTEDME